MEQRIGSSLSLVYPIDRAENFQPLIKIARALEFSIKRELTIFSRLSPTLLPNILPSPSLIRLSLCPLSSFFPSKFSKFLALFISTEISLSLSSNSNHWKTISISYPTREDCRGNYGETIGDRDEWAIARNILFARIWSLYMVGRDFFIWLYAPAKIEIPGRHLCRAGLSHFTPFLRILERESPRRDSTRRAVGLSPRNSAETARFQSTSAVIPTAVRAIFRKYWRAEGWRGGGGRIGTHHGLIFFRPVGKDLLKFLCVSPRLSR